MKYVDKWFTQSRVEGRGREGNGKKVDYSKREWKREGRRVD